MPIDTSNLDSGGDKPKDARAQLLAAVQELNRVGPVADSAFELAPLGQRALAFAQYGVTATYIGVSSPATGFSLSPGTATFTQTAITGDGVLESIKVRVAAAGSGAIDVLVANLTGSNTLQVVDRFTVNLTATGVQTLLGGKDFALRAVSRGQYIGFYAAAGGPTLTSVSGGALWSRAGDPGAGASLYTPGGQTAQWGCNVVVGQSPAAALSRAESAMVLAAQGQQALAFAQVGVASTYAGVASPAGGFLLGAGYAFVSQTALTSGTLESIKLYVAALGSGLIDALILQRTATNTLQVVDRFSLVLTATGVVTLYGGKDFALRAVQAERYLGFFAAAGGPALTCVSGGALWSLAGDPGSGANVYSPGGQTAQWGCSIVVGQSPAAALSLAQSAQASALAGQAAYSIQAAQAPSAVYGVSTPAAASSSIAAGQTTWSYDPATFGGLVDRIQLYIAVRGNGAISVVFGASGTSASVKRRVDLTAAAAGLVEFVAGRDFEAVPIAAGWSAGIYTPAGGAQGAIAYGGGACFTYAGDPGYPGDPAQTYAGQSIRLQVNVRVVPAKVTQASPWVGQSIMLPGDSITYQALFVRALREVTGLTVAGNQGSVGQVLRTMADGLTSGNMAGVPLVLIGTAVNDWHHGSSTLGSPTDAASANTIYGAVRNLVEKVHAANPSTIPAFWGPINSGAYAGGPAYGVTNVNGLNITNITAAMEDACGRLGVPFFPTQRRVGVNDLNLATWMPDNLHPAQPLADRLGVLLGQFLNGVAPR